MKFSIIFASTYDVPEQAPFEGAYLAENEVGKTLWHADISSLDEMMENIRKAGSSFILDADQTITIYDARLD